MGSPQKVARYNATKSREESSREFDTASSFPQDEKRDIERPRWGFDPVLPVVASPGLSTQAHDR
jgi:hypothetical protein